LCWFKEAGAFAPASAMWKKKSKIFDLLMQNVLRFQRRTIYLHLLSLDSDLAIIGKYLNPYKPAIRRPMLPLPAMAASAPSKAK